MFLISDTAWEVRDTLKKGKGIFAKKDIDPGIIIGDYRGTVLKTAEALLPDDKENFYLMYYHDHASIFPDLAKPGIHLLNHSCTPTCWMYTYQGHTLFFSLRKIFKGEELTISYLLGPKNPTCKNCTHICTCGSSFCTKSFHLSEKKYTVWNTFHEAQIKETKRQRIHYGKQLLKLSTYPKTISDNPIYTLFGSNQVPPLLIQGTTFPSLLEVRKLLRKSGKTLIFPQLNIQILGTEGEKIITKSWNKDSKINTYLQK